MSPDRTVVPIAQARAREVVCVEGRVSLIEVTPLDGPVYLIARVDDGTGSVDAVFLGRREIPGIEPGRVIRIEGRLVSSGPVPHIFNPTFELRP